MDPSALVGDATTYTRACLVSFWVGISQTTPAFHALFLLAFAFTIFLVYKFTVKPRTTRKTTGDPDGIATLSPPPRRHVLPSTAGIEKAIDRDVWTSPTGIRLSEIRRIVGTFPDYSILTGVPHPKPCPPGFDLSKARFRPFRPFRWRYHQHMALMKLDSDYWLELEHNYRTSLAARRALLETHREKIMFCTPEDEIVSLACRELLEMVLQFVCQKYPSYFEVRVKDNVFVNRVLNTEASLDGVYEKDALQILFDNIPEDFAIVTRSAEDGRYRLRAATVCSSVGWCIGQHRGRPLHEIHGKVTDYAAKMARSMDRFFARMPTDQPIQRGSWSLEEGRPLFVEDDKDRPARPGEDNKIHLRCDWQTLRRLPLTGAIVFNFKPVFAPLTSLRNEPYVPALLHQILDQGDQRLVTPGKCMEHVRIKALPLLKSWADEQVEAGIVAKDWEPRTLEKSPFYPGWEAEWHKLQGF